MTLFDRIREKNKLISLMVKIQNSAFYPALFAVICIFSGTGDESVYLPCMWLVTALTVLAGLFSDDLKVFVLPAFMGYYFLGMDAENGYFYPSTESLPPFNTENIIHFTACICIMLAVIVYRMIVTGMAKEMLTKRGLFFWGLLLFGGALTLGGLFSPSWRIHSLLFGLMIALILLIFYMFFVTILSHSKDGIAYACKCLVFMGYAVLGQILILAYRLHSQGILVRQYGTTYILNRHLLSLSWGVATIIGGVIVMAIVAAVYLMHNRKWPLLSFISALIFWISTVLIDTRSAIIFGAIALVFGCTLCCINGRNRIFNRVLSGCAAASAIVAVFVIIKYPDNYGEIFGNILDFLRLDFDPDTAEEMDDFFSSRLSIWWDGLWDFISSPLFGKGFAEGYMDIDSNIPNYYTRMYHNIIVQLAASLGVVGLFTFAIHIKHMVEVTMRRFSVEKLLVLLMPFCIAGMSLVDNFFFYPNFIIVYTAFIAAAEVTLEQSRQARLDNLKRLDPDRKPRVVFTYVEAGKGHIVPTKNICDEFRKHYGDECEIVESKFFTETGDPNLEKTEVLFRKAVQNQNRSPVLSFLCKLGNLIAGDNFALYVLLRTTRSGIKTNPRAVKHIEELDADVVYSAHWSTPFYINQLKTPRPYTICFCPDVQSNGAFNVDCNNFLISNDVGYAQVNRIRMYAGGNITQIPFPMRPEAEKYKDPAVKAECRARLGIPEDEFVVALCDGGYGMARLEKTVKHLLRSNEKMTVIALCGMNHELYLKLDKQSKNTPEHIRLIAVDFTDKMLEYLACADVFAGKSGANAIAEPASMGVPIVVTKCITYIERGIKNYYVRKLKGAVYIPNSRLAARRIRRYAAEPALLDELRHNLLSSTRQTYDAKASADLIWQRVCEMRERSNS